MPPWHASAVLADSKSLTAGEAVGWTFPGAGYHTPVVCINLEDLEGNTDDTLTVAFDGDAATYEEDSRTLSEVQSYTVDLPQCEGVQVTSSNGCTYSVEVRNNPR
ncbi:hypothetical protein [Halobacterium sp. CBA1126]|uniref:hypothetical protein n=1 Tax=Halobacterium sp. CBA1126 TaxID=2668074 RepID=UPI0012FCF719|nr:hypothetical protein [Halobacterium sp. CBA1126]MUV59982.1 hypothetical protein [Halobacterium sp. CBA1126]